ncbi:lysophospholipid acyltransferase family protein [Flammeovirga agarivorans]|uniref:Acetyltransferase n=1 Tax=Flammeovirga agarivorans TaxID=2726742 RepID=A0A7X8SHE7_9BACT|nr:lysophospholipid acyltransferase family protein [Flammeovirga agarivorans]NLR90239.1 acetyltransferase [Flammeovirga agarivorans]
MFFIQLLSKIPFSLLHIISTFLAFVTGKIIRYRRDVVAENIKIAFPEKSEAEHKKIVDGFYTNLSDVALESIKSLSMSKEDMKQHFKVKNPEVFNKFHDKNQPVILMCGHVCNWEWQMTGFAANFDFGFGAVYKPLEGKFSEQLMQQIRSRFGGYVVPMANTMRQILVRKKKGENFGFGMVSDQSPPGYDRKRIWIDFFGRPSAFFAGPEVITGSMKIPVIYSRIIRTGRSQYEAELFEIYDGGEYEKGSNLVLTKYAQLVEENIKAQPSNWLWSHKRWKYTKEEMGE